MTNPDVLGPYKVPRLLILEYRTSASPRAEWPSDTGWLVVESAGTEIGQGEGLASDAHSVRAYPAGSMGSVKVAAAWAKTQVRARAAQAPPGWLWAIRRDPWVRRTLQDVDVVVSLDVETDRSLSLVPELLTKAMVVKSHDAEGLRRGLTRLADGIEQLRHLVAARQEPSRIRRRGLDESEMVDLQALGDPTAAALVPGRLLPVVEVSALIRRLDACLGRVPTATILLEALGDFRWDSAPMAGTSGLAAQLGNARLWLAATEIDLPDDDDLFSATEAALAGADLAWEADDEPLARERLSDALSLMFHRERHAESGHSALVVDPEPFLRSMYASKSFIALIHGGTPRSLRSRSFDGDQSRVLVLASASGAFHIPVAAALAHVAEVTVEGPALAERFLSKRGMDVQVLEALWWLRHPELKDSPPDSWGAKRAHARVTHALSPVLRDTDVILADWADRLTVWASHTVPPNVRFVIRIHSLDALQPWFHMVQWSNVDLVLVQAETIRRIVEQMLQVAGVKVPVRNVPNLIAMGQLDQPKRAEARTTLGMIGWGRRVKDPWFALELLAREPSWHLVLIGRGLNPPTSRSAAAYNAEVEERLADPSIASRVKYVGWTDDVPGELRRIGVILSTSRREGWHLGLVEGAASGAVPVVRDWPIWRPVGGARSVYPSDWVVDDLDQAEARIRAVTDPATWDQTRLRAQAQAQALFDPERAAQQYCDLILGPDLVDASTPR